MPFRRDSRYSSLLTLTLVPRKNERIYQLRQKVKKPAKFSLERISLNTNWFETKTKYDPIYRTRVEKQKMKVKNETALKQIKIIRNRKLGDLYQMEAEL